MSSKLGIQNSVVDEVSPQEAWAGLKTQGSAVVVDVRSRPEWSFSGKPDLTSIDRRLLCVEWKIWPQMAPNLGFLSDLEEMLIGEMPERFFFLCRTGDRSFMAVQEFSRQMQSRGINLHCTNIRSGFEGEKDESGHRGKISGWKAEGLPWMQD
ncbi:MAG: rhodanese-like domain-containing protein [Ruegeria sp.]|uniref:rhodanese-like domain-containing protein n=1 Tax=Ruegeria sp. TaxID=1879320 RepID=UPI00349ECBCB